MVRRIVIIGANASGIEAASAVRKRDRTAEITLITKEKTAGYSRCGLPFVISGTIPLFKDLIVYPPAYFQMLKLNLRTQTIASIINTKEKTVTIQTPEGAEEIISYDSLVIATGAEPVVPPIKGVEKQGILSLRSIEDGEKIEANIKAGAKSAIIMGAGLIGLEVGVALIERGLQVTVVEMQPQILPQMLDNDMAEHVKSHLEQHGMKILLNRMVEEILGGDKASAVRAGGEILTADIVINAFGVRANTKLALDSGIPLGETQAIKTNAYMETDFEEVYAVGDCAETAHAISCRPICPKLGTVAVRQGKVAGANVGGDNVRFLGALVSTITRLFDVEVGATGISETEAKKNGNEIVVGVVNSKSKADYYPSAKPIRVKLIVEKKTDRLIGAQIVGGEEVTQRINALSFAIQKKMTIRELAKADTAYAPQMCEIWDPMVLAAERVLMKLR
ncbi:MAG: FAD-dependent oxidoreductase [Candidatus Bathyarchaeota archaeon]|nr:FAD-dependent oxidoreductase [Candidatus Termiticorpusculum sp.]MCL1970175.1 FAD-dependent oxidoreductase [Candidatus Termiticorpusculum sp.]